MEITARSFELPFRHDPVLIFANMDGALLLQKVTVTSSTTNHGKVSYSIANGRGARLVSNG